MREKEKEKAEFRFKPSGSELGFFSPALCEFCEKDKTVCKR